MVGIIRSGAPRYMYCVHSTKMLVPTVKSGSILGLQAENILLFSVEIMRQHEDEATYNERRMG